MSDQYNQTIRDELNEIRAVGKGSRGGKGARAKSNGGKLSTRRQSTKEIEREDHNIAALGVSVAKMFTTKDKKEADKLLIGRFKLAAMEKDSVPAFWTAVGAEPGAKFILKGDAQHREALKLVYALAVKVASSDDFDIHMRMIAEQLEKWVQASKRKRQNRKIVTFDDLLRALTRLKIDFGKRDDEDERFQVWCIAAAIRYLRSKNVKPHQVDKFHAEHGGGLRKWALRAPQTTTTDKKKAALVAKAIEEDRNYRPLDLDYYEDDGSSPPSEPVEPIKITEWESIFLRYCADTMGLEPSGVLITVAAGDASAPHGAQIILSSHLKDITTNRARLKKDAKMLAALAERLFRNRHQILGLRRKAKTLTGARWLGVNDWRRARANDQR